MRFLCILSLSICLLKAQNNKACFPSKPNHYWFIASYNVENLFDTEDAPNFDDSEFLPSSHKKWTPERYQTKLQKLSEAILSLHPQGIGPDILGLIEVENKKVVEDLMKTGKLAQQKYQIVHYESADKRGIDVALCFKTSYIQYLNSSFLRPYDSADTAFSTRDILMVTLLLHQKDTLHLFVNHWPSRRTGSESEQKRILVASLLRKTLDSLQKANPNSKIILMGDFNDTPFDKSISQTLQAKNSPQNLSSKDLWDAMAELASQGKGTYKYKQEWNMLDQFILSANLVLSKKGLRFHQACIHDPAFLQDTNENYKGSPFRTYAGNKYLGGYSDHFPILLILSKK